MLEGPSAERVYTRLLAPDPGNTGVGKALYNRNYRVPCARCTGMLFRRKASFLFLQSLERGFDYGKRNLLLRLQPP